MRRAIRVILALMVLPLAMATASCARPAETGPVVTVYKTPTCGCCTSWADHLEEHGFVVQLVDRPDLTPIKRQHGVPDVLASCHTGVVDGYVIEGHVPAEVIRQLLAERPDVRGIAVPGMPIGSPGMEMGSFVEPYEVFTFDETGPRGVYAVR